MVLPEGTEVSKTYLHFSVKDQSPVLGEGLLLGEALLPLSQIVKEDGDVSLRVSVKQTLAIGKLIIEGAISSNFDFHILKADLWVKKVKKDLENMNDN